MTTSRESPERWRLTHNDCSKLSLHQRIERDLGDEIFRVFFDGFQQIQMKDEKRWMRGLFLSPFAQNPSHIYIFFQNNNLSLYPYVTYTHILLEHPSSSSPFSCTLTPSANHTLIKYYGISLEFDCISLYLYNIFIHQLNTCYYIHNIV